MKILRLLFVTYFLFIHQEAFSQVGGGAPALITMLRTGWAGDIFAIGFGQLIVNPANCESPDSYVSISSEPGYKTHYAAVLMAYATTKHVSVVVSSTECSMGRPRIISIVVE